MFHNYKYSSITHMRKYAQLLFIPVLLIFLLALPAVAPAATPWYSSGKAHTLTLTENGAVWAIGGNDFGQLGNGTLGNEAFEPKMIAGLDGVVAVLAGSNHSVALKKDGTVWTWGFNGSGQLGDDTTRDSPFPYRVAGVSNVKSIATGSSHVVALKYDGSVWAWGGNHSGQVGNGGYEDCLTPVQVAGLEDVTAIVAGEFNTSALKKDGTVWSWGFNGKGQLGNGGTERSSIPVPVAGLAGVHALAAGVWHVVALKQDGTIWAWGSNHASQLGRTNVSFSLSPVQVQGIANITDITASVGHTIAIALNDTVWAWGDSGTGQWGNGISLEGSVYPVQVSGYNGLVTVAAVVNPETVLRDTADGSAQQSVAGAAATLIAQINRQEGSLSALH